MSISTQNKRPRNLNTPSSVWGSRIFGTKREPKPRSLPKWRNDQVHNLGEKLVALRSLNCNSVNLNDTLFQDRQQMVQVKVQSLQSESSVKLHIPCQTKWSGTWDLSYPLMVRAEATDHEGDEQGVGHLSCGSRSQPVSQICKNRSFTA